MDERLPLRGVQVLELAGLIPGPYATMLLGDLGAEVIKVEATGTGDYQRHFGPETDGVNHRFATYNRNKRSISIDLKSEEGRSVFFDLVEESDVVLEGFRPGVVSRLGVDYDAVSAVNPSIVYCSVSGYGQTGPYRDWPGHDVNYLGITGFMDMTGQRDGPPTQPGYPIADLGSGVFAAFAVVSALRHSERTGEGDYIDLSMTDVITSWATQLLSPVVAGEQPTRGETFVSGSDPTYNVYECADGNYITVGALEPQFWAALCDELGLEAYADADLSDEAVREELFDVLSSTFETRTRDEWLDELDPSEVPVGPVNSVTETLLEDPQIEARDLLKHVDGTPEDLLLMDSPFKLGSDPETIREPAPDHGEDTDGILEELGYDSATVADLRDDGVVE